MTWLKRLLPLALLGATVTLAVVGVHWVTEERARTAPAAPSVNVQTSWEVFRAAPGHVKHVGEMKLECGACHDVIDGGTDQPGPARCASCHEDMAALHHGLGDASSDAGAGDVLATCTDCHGFGPDPEQRPEQCLRCHGEPQGGLSAVTVHARDSCLGCHEPHADSVRARRCAECHEVQVEHGAAQPDGAGDEAHCTTCHDPHAEAAVALDRCKGCHGEGGLEPIPASAGHAGKGCAACHSEHRFTKASVTPCQQCHAEVHVLAPKSHGACSACHAPHALNDTGVARESCGQCHRKIDVQHGGHADAAHDGGPRSCVTCHAPHQTHVPKSTTCAGCHELGQTAEGAHAGGVQCTACHAAHDFEGEAAAGCESCHASRLRALRKYEGHADCAGCHQGLPHLAGQPVRACASCHGGVASTVAAGHAECARCHDAHETAKPRAACTACHAQRGEQGHARFACTGCHDAHAGATLAGVADCSGCHARAKLPGLHRLADHARCADCHAVHGGEAPGQRSACLSCHRDQSEHQPDASACNGCHTFRAPGARRQP